jgi:hypothetical protein
MTQKRSPMSNSHPISDRIIEGNGSRESPFVIHTSSYLLSAEIQKEIIDKIHGPGTYSQRGNRLYYSSERGAPGNGDLCEHKLSVNGQPVSIWFDLSLVTKLVNDPGLRKAKQEMLNSPTGQRVQAEFRRMMMEKGGGSSKPQKDACFVATAIYGDLEHPSVCVLRTFRDSWLAGNVPGRAIIASYYRIGPSVSFFLVKREVLRRCTKVALDCFVLILR